MGPTHYYLRLKYARFAKYKISAAAHVTPLLGCTGHHQSSGVLDPEVPERRSHHEPSNLGAMGPRVLVPRAVKGPRPEALCVNGPARKGTSNTQLKLDIKTFYVLLLYLTCRWQIGIHIILFIYIYIISNKGNADLAKKSIVFPARPLTSGATIQ